MEVLLAVIAVASLCACFYCTVLIRKAFTHLINVISPLRGDIESLLQLREKLEAAKAAGKNPTTELSDFLTDLRTHRCGVVRIDPDTIMLRSPGRGER